MKNFVYEYMKKILIVLVIVSMLTGIYSCKKKPAPKNDKTPDAPVVKPVPRDTISRNWVVDTAFHLGDPDFSSKGLKLNMAKDGSYYLVNTGYTGTWAFADSTNKSVVLDEKDAKFKTIWSIQSLTAKRLHVKFKSPFTGGASEWIMKSQK